jgi:hypothetical protein
VKARSRRKLGGEERRLLLLFFLSALTCEEEKKRREESSERHHSAAACLLPYLYDLGPSVRRRCQPNRYHRTYNYTTLGTSTRRILNSERERERETERGCCTHCPSLDIPGEFTR